MIQQRKSLKLLLTFSTILFGLIIVSDAQSTVDDVTQLLTQIDSTLLKAKENIWN